MTSRLGEGLLSALAHQQIGRALNVIHLRFWEDWTVNKLAEQAGMSPVFSEQFARLVKKTPMRYLTEWRMREAANLFANDRRINGHHRRSSRLHFGDRVSQDYRKDTR